MEKVKQIPKKFLAMILSFVLLLSAVPISIFSVFASSEDYISVQAGDKTIYMYGVTSANDAEIDNGKYVIEYSGGDENASGLYLNGSKVDITTEEPEIEYDTYKVSLSKAWVDSQTEWIAVKCSSASSIPTTKPLPDIEGITVTAYNAAYDEGEHDAVTIEGTKTGDVITYSEDGSTYTDDVPTIKEVGTKDVYVKIEREGHNEFASGKKTASVTKGTIDWITVTPFNGTYNPADTGAKAAVTITGEDDSKPVTIEYSTDGGTTYDSVIPTIEYPSTKEIKVKVSRNNYNDYETTVTAQMASATIEGITVSVNANITYDGIAHPVVLEDGINGLQPGDEVYYSSDGSTYSEEIPSYTDAGDYDFYIKVKREYHNDYVSFPNKFTFTISKATIEGVTATGYSGKYDWSSHDAITNVSGYNTETDTITYSEDNVSYSATCPKVTFSWDSGKYYVKVHRTDNYEDLIIEVTVAINKKEQTLSFPQDNPSKYNPTTVTYKEEGNNTFSVKAITDAEEGHNSNIEYSIVSNGTTAQATVNKSSGLVKYSTVGTIIVKAKTNESQNWRTSYLEDEKEFTISVEYVSAPTNYTITEKQNEFNSYKWYSCDDGTDGFVITAPEGWNIIKGSNAQNQTTWAATVEESNEGVYTNYKVAFKNTETSEITDLVSIPNFIIDKTNPEVSSFDLKAENTGMLAKAINALSFGTFCKEQVEVTVNCTDFSDKNTSSGINTIKLFKYSKDGVTLVDEVSATEIDTNNGKAVFYIEPDFEGTIKAEVIDNVSRTSGKVLANQINSNIGTDDSGYVMIENDIPVVSSVITDEPLTSDVRKETVEGKTIYSGDVKFTFDAQDLGAGLNTVDVKVNDISYEKGDDKYPKDYSASQDREKHSFEITTENLDSKYLKEDGSFKIDVTVIDNAGNFVNDRTITVYKDETSATIKGYKFSLDKYIDVLGTDNLYKAVEVTDYGFYFKKDVTVTISADDFKTENEIASGVKSISYRAVDLDGNSYEKNDVPVDENNEIKFTIEKNFKGQIYAYATDMVGNNPNNSNLPVSEQYDSSVLIKEGDYKGCVHPNGAIVETANKHTDTSTIEFSSVEKAQGTQNNTSNYSYDGTAQKDKLMDFDTNKNVPLYNKDIEFGVTVTDTYSGIREITYTIFEGKEETVKTVKLDNTGKIDGEANGWSVTNTDSNLATEMTNTIAVSGNYNDMVLLVELTDRAGNTSYDYYVFGIDKTAPTISVRYNNNKGDSQSGTGTYFDNHRKATVVITERNFNTENVKWTIKNDEGKAPSAKLVSTKDGTGNKDNTTYTYEINYNYDGVFSFDVSYTDRATNKNTAVDYGNSLAPKAFVVDTVNPTITVSYNNNSAQNEKYFKEYRTATVTIVEHNFDVNRVKFTMTAALSGSAKAIPAVSWNHSGDTHVATINYNSDGDYTFDITMEDKSGRKEETVNYGNSVAAKDFVIDTTYSDIVKVDGVANGDIFGLRDDGSINDTAEIKITFNDVNFDKYSIHLYRNRVLVDGISENANSGDEYEEKDVITTANKNAVENDADVTEEFIGSVANGNSNTTVTFDIPAVDENKVKNDGMYTLRIEANDKAGNAYDTNSNVITFAVNRYGSVYTVDDDLYNLINDNEGYTQAIAGDIVIREYNTTDVTTNKLSILRGTTPLEGVECKPAAVSQTGVEWHEYAYKVDKSYFMDGDKYVDGEYSLIISSTDKADIKSTNDKYDTCQVGFVLDTTAPKINGITPSAESKNISLDNYLEIASDEDVTFTVPVTDNLRLSTVEIFIGDTSDDATPAYVYTYKGDKVEVNTDKGGTFNEQTRFDDCSFTLSPGTSRQNFRVIVTDKVGLTVDTADFESGKVAPEFEGFFNEVLITSNWFVRMWNRPVFKIALGSGLLAAIAASAFIIIAKKRKKDDEEQPQAAE